MDSAASQGLRPAQPLLVVENLKTYFETPRGLVKAVDGVSLKLERGRTLGIVGESGSGKSVLSRSIMGLLPKRNLLTEGRVIFNGTNLSELPRKRLRKYWGTDMAMVFQDPMTSLNPVVRIGRQITEGLKTHLGMSRKEANESAVSLLTEVGIPSPERRLREYPHQLSGGMRQRVTIAIALACGPKLLMADEPTTALDVTVQAQILELLHREQTDRDMAMVLVTHDLGVVAGRADDIAVMYGGKIVEQAPTRKLFGDLKMPYTEALLRSIPRLQDQSHTRLHAIGGRPPDLLHPPTGCNFSPRCKYATQQCREVEPLLVEADSPDHLYACWNPVGSDIHAATLERLGESPVGISSAGAAE
ncbi:MAG: ABC transporter ATP-binding protein [Acidimicrobiales bacterium]